MMEICSFCGGSKSKKRDEPYFDSDDTIPSDGSSDSYQRGPMVQSVMNWVMKGMNEIDQLSEWQSFEKI